MNIGIIGCGNISTAYLQLAPQFRHLDITACADLDDSAAQAQASRFGCQAMSVEALLADPDIGLIINLTVPRVHAEVSSRILESGKHVYSEKPYVLTVEEGQALRALADRQGLRIGSAPDTFLGAAHQLARQLIDTGQVGTIIGGTCHLMTRGMEHWHPNPDFFYQPGGGPILDMGPYYLTNLVQLIGPVKRLMAMTATPFATRTITSEPRNGETFPVGTPTTVHALLAFHSGAQVTLSISWDVWQNGHECMELYGTDATLHVPDPNFFGGEVRVATRDDERIEELDHPFATPNYENEQGDTVANYRGAGLADMVAAIDEGREYRCNDEVALHVVDIMTSVLESGDSGQSVTLKTTCKRPDALGRAAAAALLL